MGHLLGILEVFLFMHSHAEVLSCQVSALGALEPAASAKLPRHEQHDPLTIPLYPFLCLHTCYRVFNLKQWCDGGSKEVAEAIR